MKFIKGDYFIVPNRGSLSKLDSQSQTVFVWLCARADNNGVCFPSITNLCKTTNLSRPTVVNRIEKLEEEGFITKQKGDFTHSNRYQIMILASKAPLLGGLTSLTRGSKGALLGVVKEVNSNNNHLTINKNNKDIKDILKKNRKELKKKKIIR